jgi:hypothetical protein
MRMLGLNQSNSRTRRSSNQQSIYEIPRSSPAALQPATGPQDWVPDLLARSDCPEFKKSEYGASGHKQYPCDPRPDAWMVDRAGHGEYPGDDEALGSQHGDEDEVEDPDTPSTILTQLSFPRSGGQVRLVADHAACAAS